MTTQSEPLGRMSDTWDVDFPSPSRVEDFIWPEGAEVRGNVNLADRQVIGRDEVEAEWNRVKTKLLKML